MTLEELELRVRALFPEATIELWEDHGCLSVTLSEEETIATWPTGGFGCRIGPLVLMSFDAPFGNEAIAQCEEARVEIEGRILAVSAHQLIAARRRLDRHGYGLTAHERTNVSSARRRDEE